MRTQHIEGLESRRLFAVTFPQIELFNSDSDSYTPGDLNPFNDPPTGAPPPNVVDIRNGRSGLIEEIPSGAHGVPASVGANLGEVYFNDPNDGPFGRFAFNTTTPSPNPNGTNAYSFVVDIYTDSRIATTLGAGQGGHGNGSNGIPDFWWTNAVTDAVSGASYMTESGFTAEVVDTGAAGAKRWRFTTTAGGNPFFDAALNTWYTLEVKWKRDSAGNLAAEHNLFSKSRQRLYTHTIPASAIFQGPFAFSRLGGPRYSWFVYPDANVRANRLSIDNWGVTRPYDFTRPTADVVNVSPDPRTTSVSSVRINFSEVVRGFDRADLTLTRNGTAIALTSSQTLATSDGGKSWTLSGLSGLTGTNGTYVLTVRASGTGITDVAGNALASSASDTWQKVSTLTSTSTASLSPVTSLASADPVTTKRVADELFE